METLGPGYESADQSGGEQTSLQRGPQADSSGPGERMGEMLATSFQTGQCTGRFTVPQPGVMLVPECI